MLPLIQKTDFFVNCAKRRSHQINRQSSKAQARENERLTTVFTRFLQGVQSQSGKSQKLTFPNAHSQ